MQQNEQRHITLTFIIAIIVLIVGTRLKGGAPVLCIRMHRRNSPLDETVPERRHAQQTWSIAALIISDQFALADP